MSLDLDHEYWMQKALRLAKKAGSRDEVPVGAVIVMDNQLLSHGYNLRENLQTPLAHAELIAIHRAAKKLNSWRLINCTLYATLEPCIMCAGTILQARIPNLIFGAHDLKGGGIESLYQLCRDSRLNHQVRCQGGLFEKEAGALLRDFFKKKRIAHK